MRKPRMLSLIITLIGFLSFASPESVAQDAKTVPPVTDDAMMPEQFTEVLKQVWTLLKDEMTNYLSSIELKGEFETAKEFERRTTDARRQYLDKVLTYNNNQKFGERVFGVLLKATLGTYDADKELYGLTSHAVVDAPYNIPTVECVIRKNPYIALADSIRKGYRASSLYVNLPKGNKWNVTRDNARAAKADEEQIYFRAKMKIDIVKSDVKTQALLELVPTELALINKKTDQVYWTVPIR